MALHCHRMTGGWNYRDRRTAMESSKTLVLIASSLIAGSAA
jgi:hypothetical protein